MCRHSLLVAENQELGATGRAPVVWMRAIQTKISTQIIQEYLEMVFQAQQFQVSNLRHWNLLRCYAELQYRLNGGSHCSMCESTVRHVVPITVEMPDGERKQFDCLCTRCYEGERAQSKVIVMQLGEARIEQTPPEHSRRVMQFQHPLQSNRNKAV